RQSRPQDHGHRRRLPGRWHPHAHPPRARWRDFRGRIPAQGPHVGADGPDPGEGDQGPGGPHWRRRIRPAAGRRSRRYEGSMTELADVVFLVDVDNTLLDNDRVEKDLRAHLLAAFGAECEARYWQIFED